MPGDVEKPNEIKQIPDEGFRQEKKKAAGNTDKLSIEEEGAIADRALDRIKDSEDENVLALHKVFRWGIKFLFAIACVALIYILFMMCYLICRHIGYISADPVKLEQLLTSVWHVLSGAAIISFVQLLGWLLKAQHDKSRRK